MCKHPLSDYLVAVVVRKLTALPSFDLFAGLQLDEMAVIELMEHITNPEKDQGEWVAKIDLVESGDKLLVQEQDELGDCGVECKTVQRAAEEIVGDRDTDVAEELWKVSLPATQHRTSVPCFVVTQGIL